MALLRRVTDFIYDIFHVIESVLPSMSVMQQRIAGHLVKLSILLISYKKNMSLSSSCQRDYDLKEIKGHAHRLRLL